MDVLAGVRCHVGVLAPLKRRVILLNQFSPAVDRVWRLALLLLAAERRVIQLLLFIEGSVQLLLQSEVALEFFPLVALRSRLVIEPSHPLTIALLVSTSALSRGVSPRSLLSRSSIGIGIDISIAGIGSLGILELTF